MLSRRYSLSLAVIARLCRASILALMAVGLILMGAHADIARATLPGATVAGPVPTDPNARPALPVPYVTAQTASCPSQGTCHHGEPFFGGVAEAADLAPQGRFWHLIPGRIATTGQGLGLDHPPPIA